VSAADPHDEEMAQAMAQVLGAARAVMVAAVGGVATLPSVELFRLGNLYKRRDEQTAATEYDGIFKVYDLMNDECLTHPIFRMMTESTKKGSHSFDHLLSSASRAQIFFFSFFFCYSTFASFVSAWHYIFALYRFGIYIYKGKEDIFGSEIRKVGIWQVYKRDKGLRQSIGAWS
jgi:hypothetical protein